MSFRRDLAAASGHFPVNHLPQFAQHNSACGDGNWERATMEILGLALHLQKLWR